MAGAFFFGKRMNMWKIVVGFILFAALALFLLSRGGDIDMGGEKHGLSKPGVSVFSVARLANAAYRQPFVG